MSEEKLAEREFERKCQLYLKFREYKHLENEIYLYLDRSQTSAELIPKKMASFKPLFYLGICFYKQGDFESAVKAFNEAESIFADDAQL